MSGMYLYFGKERLVRTSKINGCSRKLVLGALRERILRTGHYSLKAGHPCKRHMYDIMRKRFSWAHRTDDVYQTVRYRATCTRICKLLKRKWNLLLIPAPEGFAFIPLYIVDPLPRTNSEILFILVMTDKYSIMKRALSSPKTRATHVLDAFLDQ